MRRPRPGTGPIKPNTITVRVVAGVYVAAGLRPLTVTEGKLLHEGSPGGCWLAFTSNRAGNFEICLLDVATGEVRNATEHLAIDHFPAWSPDGRLTFVSNRDGGFDIYVIDSSP